MSLLSNLDAKLRVQMRAELKKLHERLQATIIYVTHDQVEAMTMGDRDRGDEGWVEAAGGAASGTLFQAGKQVCGRIHWKSGDEFH